jgi:hypothetical protein
VWDEVPEADVGRRVRSGAAAVAAIVRSSPSAGERPGPGVWSPLEYAGHLRDVCLHVRDRLVIGLVEDTPSFKPLYRDERVDLGLYAGDDPSTVADELEWSAELFARTFERLAPGALDRTVIYVYPAAAERTLRWVGQQVVHEVEHHLGDVRAEV